VFLLTHTFGFSTSTDLNFVQIGSTQKTVSASSEVRPQLGVPDHNGSPLSALSLSSQFLSSVVLQTAETTGCRASVPATESLHA